VTNTTGGSGKSTSVGFMMAPLAQIDRDPDQVRRDWGQGDGNPGLKELTASIEQYGVLQPLVVRRDAANPERMTVIAGGRRLVACKRLALDLVPVIVRDEQGVAAQVLQLIENVQREDLKPMDQSRAYQQIMDLEGLTPPQLGALIHKTDQHVRAVVRVYHEDALREAVAAGHMTQGLAVQITQQSDEVKDALLRRIVRGDSITTSTLETIKKELAAAGIVNPRRSRPPGAGDDPRSAGGTAPARPGDAGSPPPGSGHGPIYRLVEAEPDPPRAQPEIAQHRPDPFDRVMKPGAADVVPQYGNPEHVIVERPPSPYGFAKPKIESTPAASMGDAVADVSHAEETVELAEEALADGPGTPILNRADAEPDTGPHLEDFLPHLNWDALKGALLFGVERGWSCAALYSHAVALRQ